MHRTTTIAAATGAAVALVLGGAVGLVRSHMEVAEGVHVLGALASEADAQVAPPTLAGGISTLQAHLAQQPDDERSWASLGVAYVEQARVTLNPTYYPKAQQALDRAV